MANRQAPTPTSGRPRLWLLGVLSALLSCSSPKDNAASSSAAALSDVDRAAALLSPDVALPPRPEVVALADAIAVLASKEPAAEEQAKLYGLAARLRVRAYRVHRTDGDAREALELFLAAARAGRGKELGCEVDRERAALSGEIAGDPRMGYRETYLAKRRYMKLGADGSTSPCIAGLDRDLSLLDAFRPTGDAMLALEHDGDRAELMARPAPSAADTSSAEPASSASSSASAAPLAAASDVVVAPKELAPAKGPVKVSKIDKYAAEGGGRVIIHLTEPTSFSVGSLAADDKAGKDARIFIDIDKANVKGVSKEIEVGGAVKRIRAGARGDGARIVLDLAGQMHRRVFYLPEPFRIVVDVSSRAVEAPSEKPGGPRVVKRIALDPGHGGHDGGATGPTGLKEKDVALDIAHRAAPVLAQELGIETLLTRDDDVFVPLDERAARANAFHADVFISIHCNASENGDARDIETFVLDQNKDTSRASQRVAAVENGLLGKDASLDPASFDDEMANIVRRLGNGEIAASSRVLGALLGKAVLSSLSTGYPDTSDHGIKSAGFYVLAGAEMPAILFETSFISNPDDEARLARADYRQKLADGIVNAVRAYRDGK
ncbi:MAG: N-acetylmuramoyl-L-alanine amidase [Polyangiaceae bacterium]